MDLVQVNSSQVLKTNVDTLLVKQLMIVTFPEDYTTDLAGRKFVTTIHEVKAKEVTSS